MQIPVGNVACQSAGNRILLHLMREDLTRTLCGRYPLTSILPEDTDIPDGTRDCGACKMTADRSGRQPDWLASRNHVADGQRRSRRQQRTLDRKKDRHA